MVDAIALLVGAILRLFRARQRLVLENLALRQQLTTLKRRHPKPRLSAFDKLFWVLARANSNMDLLTHFAARAFNRHLISRDSATRVQALYRNRSSMFKAEQFRSEVNGLCPPL